MESLAYNRTLAARWAGVFLFAVLAGVDQFVKMQAHRVFQNRAFAFSLPVPTVPMYAIYCVVVLLMLVYCWRHYHRFSKIHYYAWLLIWAGALSNIIERLVLGYVRDFIYITAYRWTGIYNLADFYIVIGIVLLLLPKSKNI